MPAPKGNKYAALWFDFKLFFEDIKTNDDYISVDDAKLWFDFKLFFEDIKTNFGQ